MIDKIINNYVENKVARGLAIAVVCATGSLILSMPFLIAAYSGVIGFLYNHRETIEEIFDYI